LERLKGRKSVKEGFYKLLLLRAWDAYEFLTRTVGCPSVPYRQLKPEGYERFTKGLFTELLHNGSYTHAHPLDDQKLIKPRKQQVGCNALVSAAML
jgi:hypothetical protein